MSSGKSSLVLSILQMLELQSGSIIIDGIDLSTLARESVRTRFVTVPQDFVLLNEPIRFALDPHREHSDDSVIEVLRKVQIWDILREREGLETMGSLLSISHGQRQLCALARAVLSSGRIVILDEACSRLV
jgi:ATP-binding cassette subfamily C (CFTR/MRP) protein 1